MPDMETKAPALAFRGCLYRLFAQQRLQQGGAAARGCQHSFPVHRVRQRVDLAHSAVSAREQLGIEVLSGPCDAADVSSVIRFVTYRNLDAVAGSGGGC